MDMNKSQLLNKIFHGCEMVNCLIIYAFLYFIATLISVYLNLPSLFHIENIMSHYGNRKNNFITKCLRKY